MKFTKMHGLGNDYVFVNCFEENITDPAHTARVVSDRHFGIGADGLVLICPSQKADIRMRIFNADGSEAQMCGNGIRCAAKYAYEHKLCKTGPVFTVPGQPPCPGSLRIETVKGVLTAGLLTDPGNKVRSVCVNMGQPVLSAADIPVSLSAEQVIEQPFEVMGTPLLMTLVSMGNPHAVFFCENVDQVELEKLGPAIENHRLFPQRVNVHFAQVLDFNQFRMRSWERGSGITLACGTGACASCVAAVLTNRCSPRSVAHLPGGQLDLYWCQEDNSVYMTGPATEVFEGVFECPQT